MTWSCILATATFISQILCTDIFRISAPSPDYVIKYTAITSVLVQLLLSLMTSHFPTVRSTFDYGLVLCLQLAGITFSPDGNRAYVTDTGIALGFYGRNLSSPASVYQFDVNKDGTWQNRKTFAYVASFIPDGRLQSSTLQS